MTKENVQEVIDTYRAKFHELKVGVSEYPHDQLLEFPRASGLEHCHSMLGQMEDFLKEDLMEKVFRWLGFIQGFLWSEGVYTLDELRHHNS